MSERNLGQEVIEYLEREKAAAVEAMRLKTIEEHIAICNAKNAAMAASGEYQHGYWDACNEIRDAIKAEGR